MEAYFVYVARILHTFASFLNASFLKELFDVRRHNRFSFSLEINDLPNISA